MNENKPYMLKTGLVRQRYIDGAVLHLDIGTPPSQNSADHEADFNTWLAAHDAQVARAALNGLAAEVRVDWNRQYNWIPDAIDEHRDTYYPEEPNDA